jgi:Flp pilus assembly protein TadG
MRSPVDLLRDRRATSAVEFAIIAPLFLMALLSMVAYGIYFAASITVEQLAADAARYSIAGTSTSERQSLAQQYIQTVTISDPFIERDKLQVSVNPDPSSSQQFQVSLSYNAKDLPIWDLFTFALPSQTISKSASIRIGGV